jgi:hypothetical protein
VAAFAPSHAGQGGMPPEPGIALGSPVGGPHLLPTPTMAMAMAGAPGGVAGTGAAGGMPGPSPPAFGGLVTGGAGAGGGAKATRFRF